MEEKKALETVIRYFEYQDNSTATDIILMKKCDFSLKNKFESKRLRLLIFFYLSERLINIYIQYIFFT